MTPVPLALLRRSLAALEAELPLPPECAEWLRQGLAAYLDGADLLEGLALKPQPGQRDPRRRAHLAQRDRVIRTLARLASGGLYAKAGRLLDWHQKYVHGRPVPPAAEPALAELATLAEGLPAEDRLVQIIRASGPG